jgi:transposase, IS30 family
MPKGYQQLTYDLRCQIYALKKSDHSNRAIAKLLGKDRRTVDREIARNTGLKGYRYKQAEASCQARRHRRYGRHVRLTPALKTEIAELLARQWSPEQIAGRLKREQGHHVISAESIYQYILSDKTAGGRLYQHLRRRGRHYLKRFNGKTRRGQIKGRVDIDQRPSIVEARTRIGDWEGDTIVGKDHQGALVSLVDRTSRFTRLVKVERSTAVLVTTAIKTALAPYPTYTLTFDNGKEFAHHGEIARVLQAQTYFAKPYHSWERGTNENTNGLVRQYFPKKTDFATVTEADVARVEYLLNTRPRKCLGYRTPMEVIHQVA